MKTRQTRRQIAKLYTAAAASVFLLLVRDFASLIAGIDPRLDDDLQLGDVRREAAYALGELLRRHGVLVHHPPERILVGHVDLGDVHLLGLGRD